MKTCSVCGKPLPLFHSFAFQEGKLCPDCYEKASHHFSRTIKQDSLAQVLDEIAKHEDGQVDVDFEISEKVGSYLLIDKTHRKICILKGGRLDKDEYEKQIYLEAKEIQSCQIKSKGKDLKDLQVVVQCKGRPNVTMVLVPNPIRESSFAYSQSLKLAKRMQTSIDALCA